MDAQQAENLIPVTIRQFILPLIFRLLLLNLGLIALFLLLVVSPLFAFVGLDNLISFTLWSVIWTILILGFGVLINLYLLLAWYNHLYIIGVDEITETEGVLWRRDLTLEFPSLDILNVRQGILGRIFNFGDVEVVSTETNERVHLKQIPRPQWHANLIELTFPTAERF